MNWTNGPLELYHGTIKPYGEDIRDNGIDLRKSRARTDFGKGFYLTSNFAQARTHATNLYRRLSALKTAPAAAPVHAACIATFSIDRVVLAGLKQLTFVCPNQDWRDFVTHCRTGGVHLANGTFMYYDVVWGPVQMLDGSAFAQDHDQLSFHSQALHHVLSLTRLKFGTPLL